MIPGIGSIELAHARLWARHARRADEATWARLGAIRDLAAWLEAARATGLARWIRGIVAGVSAHDIERELRAQWRSELAELASWMPPEWREAIEWTATGADLPVVAYAARRSERVAWMMRDDRFRAWLSADAGASVPRESEFARIAAADDPLAAWLHAWRSRLPAAARADPWLVQLGAMLSAATRAADEPAVVSSAPARQRLRTAVEALFRRAMLDPVAALAYVVLVALDLERLRGELVRRAIFATALTG